MPIKFGDFVFTLKSGILIPILVLIPNFVWVVLPKVKSTVSPSEPLLLTIFENMGRFATLLIPLFYAIQWQKKYAILILTLMGTALLIYYIAWGRYFFNGRSPQWMSKPLFGIPLPLATAPILIFILSSYILGSWWMLLASLVFGFAHIWISTLTLKSETI